MLLLLSSQPMIGCIAVSRQNAPLCFSSVNHSMLAACLVTTTTTHLLLESPFYSALSKLHGTQGSESTLLREMAYTLCSILCIRRCTQSRPACNLAGPHAPFDSPARALVWRVWWDIDCLISKDPHGLFILRLYSRLALVCCGPWSVSREVRGDLHDVW